MCLIFLNLYYKRSIIVGVYPHGFFFYLSKQARWRWCANPYALDTMPDNWTSLHLSFTCEDWVLHWFCGLQELVQGEQRYEDRYEAELHSWERRMAPRCRHLLHSRTSVREIADFLVESGIRGAKQWNRWGIRLYQGGQALWHQYLFRRMAWVDRSGRCAMSAGGNVYTAHHSLTDVG